MIYFDNAATGFPKNPRCADAMVNALMTCGNSGRSVYEYANNASLAVFSAREAVARLFGALPENTVLTGNATYALNTAINGMAEGGGIIISDLEHNSVARPAFAKYRLDLFKTYLHNDDETVRSFESAFRPDTALVCVTHASNVCGKILPVRRLAEVAKAHGVPFIVDASQTAGHFPFTIDDIGCDALCVPCHKGLYAPTGTGALLLKDGVSLPMPFVFGGTGSYSLSRGMPEMLPDRLEAGTPNVCCAAAVAAACNDFEYPEEDGQIFAFLLSALRAEERVTLYGAPDGDEDTYVPLIAFNLRGASAERVSELLASHGVCVRGGYHCSPFAHKALKTPDGGCVRISIGKSNTLSEAEEFMHILRRCFDEI